MNRIDQTFRTLGAARRKALVAYFTAGDPDFDTSLRILLAACAAGVDILEIGVPFSDPTCDGPVIQAASARALKSGMSLSNSIRLAAAVRAATPAPVVLFSYYNPLFKYGLQRVADEVDAAGVDGMLVVDLPPEEAGPLSKALRGKAIHLIRLAAPTTRPDRVRMLTGGAGGFLYLISRLGVTGTGGLDYAAIAQQAAAVKAACPLPVCLGFGISTGADARALAPLADGLIVGSAFVRLIGDAPPGADLPGLIADKVRELRSGMDTPS
ncbi:MAG: tryptophan synthase subunit alpha [Kiritimatiellia bacterium]|jgi:tryptophan synthase alpha chain|nr:tryptophan synthase subunit alpha [Kiritimatiellia bacterium]